MTQGELKGSVIRPAGAIAAEQPDLSPTAVFSTDAAMGPDHLGHTAHAQFLAEVIAHRAAGTPLTIGIFGPAGSGKSSFVGSMLQGVEAIGRAATEAGIATPFHGAMVTARVTARPGSDAARALMGAIGSALAPTHPGLLGKASYAGLDARRVARDAADQLDAARTRLDAERQSLDGITGRRARLAETVLFESEGSGVDTYLRGNRSRIERRMRAFGVADEPLSAFKQHVWDAHEATAPLARGAGWLRAFYGYRGQGRLLVLAVLLVLLAWGLAVVADNQDTILAKVQSGGDKTASVAEWLQAQWHWLEPARHLLELGAVLAVLINLARGIGFILPVQRGADLLRSDLDSRRRELDSRIAHQTRRVDTIARDVQGLGHQSAEAESRLQQGAAGSGPAALPPTADGDDADARAQHFFATLSAAMTAPGASLAPQAPAAPTRIVVALDGLDQLASADAAAFLQTAAHLLARPGLVLIFAADRAHLAAGLAETDPALAAERLRRIVQIPFRLGADDNWAAAAGFARKLLGGGNEAEPDELVVESAVSALDRPWSPAERRVIEAVAPLAGSTPRAVKQFVNLYRIARADPSIREGSAKELAGLALGLAVQARGLPRYAVETASRGEGADEVFDTRRGIGSALGAPFSALDGQRGSEIARSYDPGP